MRRTAFWLETAARRKELSCAQRRLDHQYDLHALPARVAWLVLRRSRNVKKWVVQMPSYVCEIPRQGIDHRDGSDGHQSEGRGHGDSRAHR